MLRQIETRCAPAAIGPYSQAVVFDKLLYTSGQIPARAEDGLIVDGGIEEQTEQVISNIKDVLNAGGADLSTVIKTTCFLSDMKDFDAFNKIYAAHFEGRPARSCVAAKGLPKGVLVEMEAIAFVK